jgi:CheY-like chemotaxis protein
MQTLTNAIPYIIAVDNEKDLLMLFKSCLTSWGFEVATSLNAADLWSLLLKKKADVIFLDIHMDGVDGGAICEKLKKNKTTAGIPVIMLSGNDNIEVITKQFCADGFLKKPFTTQKIVEVVNRVLAKRVNVA